jgi:hypothetical protein
MKLSRIAVLSAVALSLYACATRYGAADISASQIDPATLQITGRADQHTATETIQLYILMRAAEETTNRGFDMFLIVPSPDGAAVASSSSHTAALASGKTGETMLVMMFHGEKPSNAPANLFRASDILNPGSP